MVHVIFDTSLTGYEDAFFTQTGGGGETSSLDGIGDPPVYTIFKGSHPYQRGWVSFFFKKS